VVPGVPRARPRSSGSAGRVHHAATRRRDPVTLSPTPEGKGSVSPRFPPAANADRCRRAGLVAAVVCSATTHVHPHLRAQRTAPGHQLSGRRVVFISSRHLAGAGSSPTGRRVTPGSANGPTGPGGTTVTRISGPDAFRLVRVQHPKGCVAALLTQKTHPLIPLGRHRP